MNGCNARQALSNSEAGQSNQPLLLFQKSPCLGTCPAYNATIYQDGSISFVEFKNALAQDTILFQLPEEELRQLKQELEKLKYKDLQNSYLSNWSDISTTSLTFYEDGKEVKQVRHEEGGPQRLVQFQEWLHKLIWQRAEEKKRPTY
ncbi:hypothetical protein DXT99_04150 [Pontibacter diazotrophicus]|uniref:DUF6438 domain-containing protein n=2 Tax=Pontibacter diazotrophicus TaxID=1400979 RepID=A0A3D8LHM4_9BACT|nr:hypothetical protein DXT99_04150 [Pontibacter diazotrophicus]